VEDMKRRLLPLAFAICVIEVMWTSDPAMAKGPSQAVITGPGLADPILLREPDAETIGADLATVLKESGFFVGVWGGDPDRLTHRLAGDLGPRYTITYDMPMSDRRSDTIIQYVYPYAEPKPITYMPAKQAFWGSEETVGTWYVARVGLRETLIGLGLPASAPSPPVAGIDAPTAAVPEQTGSIRTRLLAGAVVFALALATVSIRRHRAERSVPS
jgi:hypothetical protein